MASTTIVRFLRPGLLLAVGLLITVLSATPLAAQTQSCDCDVTNPESMKARQCSLCGEAEKQPAGTEVFFLKDVNPRKPNRWLALPKAHAEHWHRMADLPAELRTKLWTAAIAKARELFGETAWGLALNSDRIRTQCHTHIHIGKLLPGVETSDALLEVSSPAEIPVPDEDGIWVHPVAGGKLHVHRGEKITETVLLR